MRTHTRRSACFAVAWRYSSAAGNIWLPERSFRALAAASVPIRKVGNCTYFGACARSARFGLSFGNSGGMGTSFPPPLGFKPHSKIEIGRLSSALARCGKTRGAIILRKCGSGSQLPVPADCAGLLPVFISISKRESNEL